MAHIHGENLSLSVVGKTNSLQEELFGNIFGSSVWKQRLEIRRLFGKHILFVKRILNRLQDTDQKQYVNNVL